MNNASAVSGRILIFSLVASDILTVSGREGADYWASGRCRAGDGSRSRARIALMTAETDTNDVTEKHGGGSIHLEIQAIELWVRD